MDFSNQNLQCQIKSLKFQADPFQSAKADQGIADPCEKKMAGLNDSHQKEAEGIRKEHKAEIGNLNSALKMNSAVDPTLQKIIDKQNELIEKLKETEDASAIQDEIIRIQKIPD